MAYIQVGSADASPKPSARPNRQSGQTEIKGSDGAGVLAEQKENLFDTLKNTVKAAIEAAAGEKPSEEVKKIVDKYNGQNGVIDRQESTAGAELEYERALAELAMEQAREEVKDILGDTLYNEATIDGKNIDEFITDVISEIIAGDTPGEIEKIAVDALEKVYDNESIIGGVLEDLENKYGDILNKEEWSDGDLAAIEQAAEDLDKYPEVVKNSQAGQALAEKLEDMRAEALQSAKDKAAAAYEEAIANAEKAVKDNGFGSVPSQDAQQAVKDAIAAAGSLAQINDILGEAVKEIVGGLTVEGDSPQTEQIAENGKGNVDSAVESATDSGSLADIAGNVTSVAAEIKAQRDEEKLAAKQKIENGANALYPDGASDAAKELISAGQAAIDGGVYENYPLIVDTTLAKLELQKHYEQIIADADANGVKDTAGIDAALKGALGAIDAADGSGAEALDKVVADGILALDRAEGAAIVEGYLEDTDSDEVTAIAEAAKKEIAAAGSAEDVTEIVNNAKLDIEKQRAEDEICAMAGEEHSAEVKDIIDRYLDETKGSIPAIEIAGDDVSGAITAVQDELAKALEEIDLQLKKDAAKAEYADAYEAINGSAPDEEQAKAVYDAIQNASDVDGINDILAENVNSLIEGMADESASDELQKIIADYVAEVTAAADKATAENIVADLAGGADKLAEQAKSAADLQKQKDAAKAEYAEAYEAAHGQKPGADQAKAVYDAIQAATDLSGVNGALAAGVNGLIDELYDGASDEALKIAESQKAQVSAAADKATQNSTVADMDGFVAKAAAKLEVQKHCESAVEGAKDFGVTDTAEIEKAKDEALAAIESGSAAEADKNAEDGVLAIDKDLTKAQIAAAAGEDASQAIKDIVDKYVADGTGVIDGQQTSEDVFTERDRALAEIAIQKAKDEISAVISEVYENNADMTKAIVTDILDQANGGILADTASSGEALLAAAEEAIAEAYETLANYDKDRFTQEHGDIVNKEIADVTADDLAAIDTALDDLANNYTEGSQDNFEEIRNDLLNKKKQAIKDALKEYLDGASDELAEVIDEYVSEGSGKIDGVDLSGGTTSDGEANKVLDDLFEEAKAAIELQQQKDAAKSEYAEAYEAINGGAPSAEQAKDAFDAIQAAENLEEINKALGGAVKDLLADYAENSSASDFFGSIAENIGAEIDGAVAAATNSKKVADLAELIQKADDAFAFVEKYPGANKPFDKVGGDDVASMTEAIGAFEDAPSAVKDMLNNAAKDEGYADYAEKLENMLGKAKFEAAREEAIEKTEKLVREHDGERVHDVLAGEIEKIDGIQYEPGKNAGYFDERLAELEAAAADAETEIRHAQSQQRTENQLKEAVSDKEESGRYNDAQLAELESILADALAQIDAVVSGEGADGKLEVILEATIERIENVNMSSVSVGELRPDGSALSGEGDADYGEDHDGSQIWGIVTNDKGLPGGIQLVIEETSGDAMSSIEDAAQNGGLVIAEGSSLSKDELPSLVSDKEIKTTLDIYLLKDNLRVEQFDGYYIVKLLLPQNMRSMSGLQVVYVGDDGTVEVFETKVEGNYLTFTTAHFSEFYILGDTELNLWWLIITLSVILALELVVIALLAARKKRDKEGDAESGRDASDPRNGAEQGTAKMNAFVPAPLLAVDLIPGGAIPAIIALAVLVAVAASVIVALLLKGRRREEDAEEEPAEEEAAPASTPATVQEAPRAASVSAGAVAAGGAFVGAAALPLVIGEWYTRIIYDRSFEARLIQSDERTKNYYSELKNELMSYKKVTARMSWKHEAFRRGRPTVAKFVFRGKTLCLCLALDPKAYEDSKYIIDDMSEVARFEGTPLLYRIKNDRRLRYAKELIAVLLAEAERLNAESVNYADIPYEETQPLVERGLIRIVGTERVRYDGKRTSAYEDEGEDAAEEAAVSEDVSAAEGTEGQLAIVSAAEVDSLMEDEAAEASIEESVRYADKTKTGIVNVDTLSKVFAEGEKVTLEEIKKRVRSIHKKTTYIKILARGELDKALVVEADDYSVEAVKMILLTGGKVIRTRRRK